MIKRFMTLYITLHLAFSPIVSAFASTCPSMSDPGSHEECAHHQTPARHEQHKPSSDRLQNCHASEQDHNSNDRCGCHCPASTAGLVNTFVPPLVDEVNVPFVSLVQTRHSITDTPLFKPPRA